MKNNYFAHDYNSRNDPKILKLKSKLGFEGKGIYWDLIEILHEQKNRISKEDFEGYALSLNLDIEKFNAVITLLLQCNLVDMNDEILSSKRVQKNIDYIDQIKEQKSNAGKIGMQKRWENKGIYNSVITENNKVKESKGKESKGKERKGIIKGGEIKDQKLGENPFFEKFWDIYPNKKAKREAQDAWAQVFIERKSKYFYAGVAIEAYIDGLLASIERQKRGWAWRKDGGEYIPHPATWLRSHGFLSVITDEDIKKADDKEFNLKYGIKEK